MADEFIAHDWCGWLDRLGRYTHLPSCVTIVCQEWMGQADWDRAQLEFMERFPGVAVHECTDPGPYHDRGRPMGMTTEICVRLRRRLGLPEVPL